MSVIEQEAAKDPECLIAMASHGCSGLGRWWMGRVTYKVLQTSGNPVLVILSR